MPHFTKMQCVSWLSAVLVLCVCGSAVDAQCWDLADCNDLGSEDKIIECIWQCRLKQLVRNSESVLSNQQQSSKEDKEEEKEEKEEEDGLSLSILLSALAPSDTSGEQLPSTRPQRSEERPSYSMEHFRWGKPMSRKHQPVKVHMTIYTDDEEDHEEPSMDTPFLSLKRRQLESGKKRKEMKQKKNTKSTTKYHITHFRWSAPPPAKRYGGFMKPWSEQSHKPLLTLLRNTIVKNGQ